MVIVNSRGGVGVGVTGNVNTFLMASNLTGIVFLRGNEKVYLPFELFL